MSDPNPITRSIYTSQAADIEGFDSLAELALDMALVLESWRR